jgi:zeta-carotene desaturase
VQVVITPCEKYMPLPNEEIAAEMHRQVQKLFPSAGGMEPTFHSVVKIGQSLYRYELYSLGAFTAFPP